MDIRLKSQFQLTEVSPEPQRYESPTDDQNINSKPDCNSPSSIRWAQLRKLGATLYPTSSPFGKPTTFTCGHKYLVIGTFSSNILLVGYDQVIVAELNPYSERHASKEHFGPVTSLAFSSDESHIIAGFGFGYVCLIDLESPPKVVPKILSIVKPLSPEVVNSKRFQYQESHIRGIPIITCGIISKRRKLFISIDASGVVVIHSYRRVLLEYKTQSRRVLGSYEKPVPLLSASINRNIVALLTPELLEVVIINIGSNSADFKEVLKIPRVRDTEEPHQNTGVTRFSNFDVAKHIDRDQVKLIYSWGRQLKVINLDMQQPLPSCATVLSGYIHNDPIKQVDWIARDLLVIFSCKDSSTNGDIDLVKLSEQSVIDTEKLAPSRSPIQLNISGYSIYMLGKHEFIVGKFTNWADRLLAFVNNGEPTSAIKLALFYYESEGDMSVFGFPRGIVARQKAIAQTLPDLVLSAVQFSAQYDLEKLKTLIPEAIRAVAIAKIDILEPMLEYVDREQWTRKLFMDTLSNSIRDHKITHLTPAIFKEIIVAYPDPHLFFNMDLSTLDLDLAFKLCAKFRDSLGEVKIYLETVALKDYVSPLYDKDHVFGYLAFVLTSRTYPTGMELSEDVAHESKLQIFNALFMRDSEYKLLLRLLELDKAAFYAALNEGFEDTWLNENTEINRQTIVNTLVSLPSANMDFFLCIFLARNYPKYSQYLVLPETVLTVIVNKLFEEGSNQKHSDEVQLALLSLLSVYKPRDMSVFIENLISSRYMVVLQHVFRKRKQLIELAGLQLRMHDENEFWSLLNECFYSNRASSIIFITQNFQELVLLNVNEFGSLIVRQNETDLLSTKRLSSLDDTLKLKILDCAFVEVSKRGGKLPPVSVRNLYIELLAQNSVKTKLIFALEHILTEKDDIELPKVVDTLIEHARIDALAILLCRRDRKPEAMIYLLNYISELAHDDCEKHSVKNDEMTSCVKMACYLSLDITRDNNEEGNRQVKRLVETLVKNGLTNELYEVLSTLIDSHLMNMSQIANYLLDKTIYPKTSNEGTPQIIDRISIDLVRQERGLKCFFDILLNEGYSELVELIAGRAKGWVVPVDGECEICGSKIVGLGVDIEKLYEDWKLQLRGERHLIPRLEEDTLVLFQCCHSYHSACLRKMTNRKQCAICFPK